MKRCCFAVVLAALLAAGACDHAPVDPLDPRADLTSLLLSDGAATDGATVLAMPGLLHAAVRKVYTEQGIAAARTLVAELRSLHEQALEARGDDGAAAGDELQRLHAEEIRVILHVFGDGLAARVIAEVQADARQLAATVAEQESIGRTVPRARASLARIEALVAQGTALLDQGDAAAALANAARAANEADSIRRGLAEVSRLPTVAVLFDDAVARLRATDPYRADRAIETRRAFERATRDAIESGNRDRAHATVEAARREQIQFVVAVLGPAAVTRLLADVAAAQIEAGADLARAGAAGRDVVRLERMLEAARDLRGRADVALRGGDAARALDLGSHAANLVNAVRIAPPTH